MFRLFPLKHMTRWSLTPTRIVTKKSDFRNAFFKRFQSIKVNGSQGAPPPKKPTGLKALMKEYGYSAFGVYMALTAIDLPLCYILVHSLGQDEIEYYENKAKQQFGYGVSEEELKRKQEVKRIEREASESESPVEKADGSIYQTIISQFSWTEFAIAYGIHKSLIFIRVPICAAITPSIVKLLRGWGFKLGSDKLATSAAIAKDTIKDFTASNKKFGTRPNSKKRWFSWFF